MNSTQRPTRISEGSLGEKWSADLLALSLQSEGVNEFLATAFSSLSDSLKLKSLAIYEGVKGNWRCLADFYTEDVTYGWDTPNGKYEFNDRETVRETCVGAAMDPYKGWTYPYDKIVIDETRGEAFCTWWQTPPGAPKRDDGSDSRHLR